MSEKRNYTNGELGILLQGFKESFEDFKTVNNKDHDSIKTAQAYTNGTVKKHEKVLTYLKGAWAVISIIMAGLFVPLVLYYLQTKI